VLSDDKSLALFNLAAFTLSGDASIVMSRLGITRKQYYSRLNQLINVGLVTRKSSNYFLTSVGKVVYEFHLLIGQAIESYWKLKAIDSIESSIPDSSEQRKNLIDTLIESSDIKNILLNQSISSEVGKLESYVQ
jgi:predicted transcriptional regulator